MPTKCQCCPHIETSQLICTATLAITEKFQNFVGNKAKGRIAKRVFQKNKARQIFRKRTFLTPWHAHVSPVLRLALLPYYRRFFSHKFSFSLIGNASDLHVKVLCLGLIALNYQLRSLSKIPKRTLRLCSLLLTFFAIHFHFTIKRLKK